MQCMEKPAARKTTDGTDLKQAEKNRSISHIYYTSLYNIGRKIAICISKNEANLRKIQMKMLAHLCGASVKNTKKNSENAMRKPPMDDCGAKKAVSIPEEQIRPCRDRRNAAGQGAAP